MRTVLTAALMTVASSCLAQTTATIPSMPLRAFQDSIGVNIHLEYTDGKYSNAPQVLQDLQYIGVTHVRDSIPQPANYYPQGYYAGVLPSFFKAGIHFDLLCDANQTVAIDQQQWDALAQQFPGGIDSIEGPNEVNIEGVSQSDAETYQGNLYTAVHGDKLLNSSALATPVLDFTGGTDISSTGQLIGYADVTNIHPYTHGGTQPYPAYGQNQQEFFSGVPTSFPHVITETGYYTILDGNDGVDEHTQAKLILNSIMDGVYGGYSKTYIYELLDAYQGDSYGFYNFNDGSPKESATWLHDLAQLLPLDTASAAQPVQVITYGAPSDLHMVALTEANGDVVLASWEETTDYNESTEEEVNSDQIHYFNVQIEGGKDFQSIDAFSPDPYYARLQHFGPSCIQSTCSYNGRNIFTAAYSDSPVFTIFHRGN